MTSSAKTRPDGAWWLAATVSVVLTAALVAFTWIARRPTISWSAEPRFALITGITAGIGIILGIVVMVTAARAIFRHPSLAALVAFAAGVCSLAFAVTILVF